MTLETQTSRFEDADAFDEALIDVVDRLEGSDRTTAFLTRLCFILANQIGDRETLHGAIEAARAFAVPNPPAAR